ncbi:MAG: hypothetical protein ABI670_06955 [Chloroflexota bacterium]
MDNTPTTRDQSVRANATAQAASKPSPLNRRPAARRLVTIFRGPSNSGKTHLALSMAEAGIGRICVFDTEDKTRNVIGVNERFDAITSDPDTLLDDIQWAIEETDAAGRPVYSGLVLDSWNGYFDTLYGRAIELAEQQRGEGAKLTTNEVDVLQTKAKKVLDLLCRVSRRWVAITEHAIPQGQEHDDNEAGQLIIMTIGGTDYYSDVTFNLSLVLGDDFRARRIATVSKTNVGHLYQLGRKIDNLDFTQLVREVNSQAPIKQFDAPEVAVRETVVEPEEPTLTLHDLLSKAEEYGIAEIHMSKAAARYCKGKRLSQLDTDEIEFLYNRLVASRETSPGEDTEDDDPDEAAATTAPTSTRSTSTRPDRTATSRAALRDVIVDDTELLPVQTAPRSSNGRSAG